MSLQQDGNVKGLVQLVLMVLLLQILSSLVFAAVIDAIMMWMSTMQNKDSLIYARPYCSWLISLQ